jgi:hypothetical protein
MTASGIMGVFTDGGELAGIRGGRLLTGGMVTPEGIGKKEQSHREGVPMAQLAPVGQVDLALQVTQ